MYLNFSSLFLDFENIPDKCFTKSSFDPKTVKKSDFFLEKIFQFKNMYYICSVNMTKGQ